jgi:hypothetical protein
MVQTGCKVHPISYSKGPWFLVPENKAVDFHVMQMPRIHGTAPPIHPKQWINCTRLPREAMFVVCPARQPSAIDTRRYVFTGRRFIKRRIKLVCTCSRYILVGIANGYGLDVRWVGVRVSVR